MTPGASVRLARPAFWLYAAALFVATHWPALTVPGTGRPDLLIHFAVFGVWTSLLIAASYFGPALSRRNIACAALIAILFAAFDEATQAIPWVRRNAAVDDWLSDTGGVLLACAGAVLAGLVQSRRDARRGSRGPLTLDAPSE